MNKKRQLKNIAKLYPQLQEAVLDQMPTKVGTDFIFGKGQIINSPFGKAIIYDHWHSRTENLYDIWQPQGTWTFTEEELYMSHYFPNEK